MFRFIRRLIKFIFFIIFLALLIFGINLYMVLHTAGSIQKDVDLSLGPVDLGSVSFTLSGGEDPQCILVLGTSVLPDGTPNSMLKDRLDTAIELYEAGAAPKLLLSGDNGREEYDEVSAMRNYVIEMGVPAEDVFLDFAGFSTYDSVYRAKKIFDVDSLIVVTQKYHLYRAIYGCDKMNMDVRGVAAERNNSEYEGSRAHEIREICARVKDFFKWFIKPNPKYLGYEIPITGESNANDKE